MSNNYEQVSSRLAHFPPAFFAMVMGLTGLSLAWEKAALLLYFYHYCSHLRSESTQLPSRCH